LTRAWNSWLACHTEQEIADKVGITRQAIKNRLEGMVKKVPGNYSYHFSTYADPDWKPPLDTSLKILYTTVEVT